VAREGSGERRMTDKSINASECILKGLLWHIAGRCYPTLNPFMTAEEVSLLLNANNGYGSGINPTHSTERAIT
jgi:hypothetical protein